MNLSYEAISWIASLVVSFVLGWFTNWYFYKKELRKSEAGSRLLKEIRQFVGAQIRLGNDKRGRIVENPDGTIAIEWHVDLSASVTTKSEISTGLTKKNQNE